MKEKKISLVTYILSLMVMVLVVAILIIAILNKSSNKKNDFENISEKELDYSNVANTQLEKLEENEELKKFLSCVGELNAYNDDGNYEEKESDFYTSEKIMIAATNYTTLGRKDDKVTYNITSIEEAIKEIFDEEINVKDVIDSKITFISYDSKIGEYVDEGGDGTYSVYLVKIEAQEKKNGFYEVTFIYGYPSEGDLIDGKEGECDCYRTTVKIKINTDYKYCKYQLVNTKLSSEKIGKIKDFVDNTSKN